MSLDRFKVLFDHSSDAHFILGENGITECNDATVRLLKYRDKSEFLSAHPGMLSPEFQPDGTRSSEKLKKMDALAREKGFHRFEWIHKKSDGEEFPVMVTLNAVDLDGKKSLIAVWHDLTDLKRAEKRLKDMNHRMRDELETAAAFQRSLLPNVSPYSESFRTSWFYKPCEELGGDSLNIFRIDDAHVGLYVLDVTGHGVASALLSVTATHFLSGFFKLNNPREVAEGMNRYFSREEYRNHTFTLVYCVVNIEDGSCVYTSAGHIGPILLRKNGQVERLDSHGPPIGMLEDAIFGEGRFSLEKGDRLFMISDGVYEARNRQGLEWGLDGVYRHFAQEASHQAPLDHIVNTLARSAYQWPLPGQPDDDVSIVGFELR